MPECTGKEKWGGHQFILVEMESGAQYVQRVANYGHQHIQGDQHATVLHKRDNNLKMVNTCNRNTFSFVKMVVHLILELSHRSHN